MDHERSTGFRAVLLDQARGTGLGRPIASATSSWRRIDRDHSQRKGHDVEVRLPWQLVPFEEVYVEMRCEGARGWWFRDGLWLFQFGLTTNSIDSRTNFTTSAPILACRLVQAPPLSSPPKDKTGGRPHGAPRLQAKR